MMLPPNPEPHPEGGPAAADRANRLIALFYPDPRRFGEVRQVEPQEVPEPFRKLLDHRSHMTVTMEAFVGGPVGLRVLGERREWAGAGPDSRELYTREIELVAPAGEPVQYGIVSVDLAAVPPLARERILAGSAPLGRVLIEAGTLRDVRDVSLVRITAGHEFARRSGVEPGRVLHGRVAAISLAEPNGSSTPSSGSIASAASRQAAQSSRPAVELLEIPIVG